VILVRLLKVRLNRTSGVTNFRLVQPSLTSEAFKKTYPNEYKRGAVDPERSDLVRWSIDLDRQVVKLTEPTSRVVGLEFPAKPMLGCIGVAPGDTPAAPSGTSGTHGGNLDYNLIAEGAVVILPVFRPGALLFLGDGHALQGDGEAIGSGVETSMDVVFSVELRKGATQAGPRVETEDFIVSIGSQPEFESRLDRGLQVATSDMVDWLVKDYRLEPWAAHLMIGNQARYDVVTVAGSVALRVSKKFLPKRRV
jgi:acetamidase/formamidase